MPTNIHNCLTAWFSTSFFLAELQRDAPDVSVELIEQKLCAGIYCSPVERTHPIFPKWPSIVQYIISHCDTREWTALECWRYGTDPVREHNPVTVIVQVVKTSTNSFIAASRDLHDTLALFNQENVDVLFRRDTSKPFMEDCYVPVEACAGAVLLGFANDSKWHTFALTCFHAVWAPANHRDVKRLNEIPDALRGTVSPSLLYTQANKLNLALQHREFRPLDPRDPRSFSHVARRILRVDHPSLRDLNNTIDRRCAIAASMRTPQFLEYENEIHKGDDGWLPESAKAKYEAILRRIKATEDNHP
ncbi:hypothetical protein N7535_006939 [Penicillium sp. DV-2018c]|nr:hypothetical protein N7461_006972 [Penicillium sp. DV-2018c]KAJ5567633.1 hypothetical protein N7535_006939 [Penicillium sp. DV-2018c]